VRKSTRTCSLVFPALLLATNLPAETYYGERSDGNGKFFVKKCGDAYKFRVEGIDPTTNQKTVLILTDAFFYNLVVKPEGAAAIKWNDDPLCVQQQHQGVVDPQLILGLFKRFGFETIRTDVPIANSNFNIPPGTPVLNYMGGPKLIGLMIKAYSDAGIVPPSPELEQLLAGEKMDESLLMETGPDLRTCPGDTCVDPPCSMEVSFRECPAPDRDLVCEGRTTPDAQVTFQLAGGVQQTGVPDCHEGLCRVIIPSRDVKPDHTYTCQMSAVCDDAFGNSAIAEDRDRVDFRDLIRTRLTIDPLGYQAKGLEERFNPIGEKIASVYDDLLCTGLLSGINRNEVNQYQIRYQINYSSNQMQGVLGIPDSQTISPRLSVATEGRSYDDADYQTYGAFRQGKASCELPENSCSAVCRIPIPNRMTARGGKLSCRLELTKEKTTLDQDVDELFIAKHNLITLRKNVASMMSRADLRPFISEAVRVGLLASPTELKLITYGQFCGAETLNALEACFRNLREVWRPGKDRLILLNGDGGFTEMRDYRLFIDPPFGSSLMHELGHTFGLCDEYAFDAERKGDGLLSIFSDHYGYKEQQAKYRCLNPYDRCCNDHPSYALNEQGCHAGGENDCYTKLHCFLDDTSDGEKWYTNTLPLPNCDNWCAGSKINQNKRSVMGALTTGMGQRCMELPFAIGYPVGLADAW